MFLFCRDEQTIPRVRFARSLDSHPHDNNLMVLQAPSTTDCRLSNIVNRRSKGN